MSLFKDLKTVAFYIKQYSTNVNSREKSHEKKRICLWTLLHTYLS